MPEICVTIGRTRHKMVVAEHKALAERGATLVELRLDWISRTPDLTRLLANRPTPVVVTCRRPDDGGRWHSGDADRMTLLRQAIVSGVEYVDLEDDIAGQVRRFGKTRRIVSHHDFNQTPDNLEEIHANLCKLDPDIVKLVTMANSPRDNVRMLQLVKNATVPTIGFCMGDYGVVSRILCGKFGSPFTYATFSRDRVLAPGQLSFEDMKDIYRFEKIGPETPVFGVLGDPIGHSLSPLLHNRAFRHEKLKACYVPMRVPAEEFEESLKDYEFLETRGYSVTIPHKEAALKFADLADEASQEIGAANTLFKDAKGKWRATNTDYNAALESILLGLEAKGIGSLSGQRVLMLGAGGVARAIGCAVMKSGGVLTVTNRTKARGKALADQLGCTYVTWENRGSSDCDVLVNCTPMGMSPNFDETPFQQHWLRDGMVVFDTVYNPENTLLIKEAREHGCHVVSGLEMFVRQAAAQFKRFSGREAPLDFMRDTLRRSISPVRLKHSEPEDSEE
ncbi:MAG: shikimate dehydrogenase [Planctomycetaceae bacterium]|nr:shikimate dehydrogenase [Planctomycetaceae bacterium]